MLEESEQLEIDDLKARGESAVAELFSKYEDRLRRMIRFRLDRRLYGRIDSADVLQDVYLCIRKRVPEFMNEPSVPFFVWLRQMAIQVLVDTHRRHLNAQRRTAAQEVPLHRGGFAHATSLSLAAQLVGNLTSPSHAAMRDELLQDLREALDDMDEIDREVLALRHFEELTNNEVAQVLGLQKSAASNRYVRALKRLREVLSRSMGDGKSS